MDADGVGLVDLVTADSFEQFGQGHPRLHPRQVRAQAEVRATAETQEFGTDFAADDEVVGSVEDALVPVRRPRQQQHDLAVADGGVVDGELAATVRARIWLEVS